MKLGTLRASGHLVFGLWSGLGYGLGFAFRKFLGLPSIFSLGSTLSTLGNLPRGSIHHATSLAFPQIVPMVCTFFFINPRLGRVASGTLNCTAEILVDKRQMQN